MAPNLDMDLLTELVQQSGVQYITHSHAIKKAWEEIAEKYCEMKGLQPLPYKVFSVRWKNQKFYSKRKEQMKKLGVKYKSIKSLKDGELSDDTNQSETPSPISKTEAGTSEGRSTSYTPQLNHIYSREEHNLRMEEIRRRMSYDEKIFLLRKEKEELEVERARILLQLSRKEFDKMRQSECSEELIVDEDDEIHVQAKKTDEISSFLSLKSYFIDKQQIVIKVDTILQSHVSEM